MKRKKISYPTWFDMKHNKSRIIGLKEALQITRMKEDYFRDQMNPLKNFSSMEFRMAEAAMTACMTIADAIEKIITKEEKK